MIADCGINFFIFFKPSGAIFTNVILLQVLNIFAASFIEPTPMFIILSSLKLSPILLHIELNVIHHIEFKYRTSCL